MLFYLSLLIDIIIAIWAGAYTGSIFKGILFYVVLSALTTVVFILLGMLLGKNGQRVLKRKSRFYITYEDDNILVGYNNKTQKTTSIAKNCIAEILYDDVELSPYFEIEAYEWPRFYRWIYLKDLHPIYKIILYHPINN